MRRLTRTDVPSRVVTCNHRIQFLLGCLWLLTTLGGCDERPQLYLKFNMKDLVELDELKLDLFDHDGHTIAVPEQNPVSILDLLEEIRKKQAKGVLDPTISIYLNQGVQVPFPATVHYTATVYSDGPGSEKCTIAEGETTKVYVSESGQTLDVPLPFPPKLTLNQRSEAPPRPGQLSFAVSLQPSPADGAKPNRIVCPSKTRPSTYYVPRSSQIRVDVSAADSFTVFDGWDDQDCPAEGECSLRRTQTIDADTTWTAKFASWNCLKPGEFCALDPVPKRYESAVRGQSGTSAWVAPNGDVWISGLVGLPNKPSGSRGVVTRWTGHSWIDATPKAALWTKELWDIGGTVDAGTIYAVGPEGIFSLAAAEWRQGAPCWKKEAVSHFSAGAIWVGAYDGVWAAGATDNSSYPQIWHRATAAGATWSAVGESALNTHAGKTLHAIIGNDNGTLIASGREGILFRISWPPGSIVDLSPRKNTSLYASSWSQKKKQFAVASSEDIYLISSSSATVETFNPVGKLSGNLFGLWFDQVTDDEGLGLWATGSYAYNYKCDKPEGGDLPCSRIPSPTDTSKSSRRLVGPDLEHLWVVGYERDKLESAAIQLGRYCPTTQCRRP